MTIITRVALKGNQKKLYQQVQLTTKQTQPSSIDISEDKCRNPLVCRTVSVFNHLLGISSEWEGIKSLIKVERQGKRAGVDYDQTAYYISSLELSAAEFAVGIQGHWGIENRLHWVKDVVFGEDKSLIRHSQAAANFSVIRQLAIAICRLHGYSSLTTAIRTIAHDLEQIFLLL
ncbi:MAG: ISAs1 family transposase [Okeania sp. SIO1H4]|nr:ISAs1 family transposase [Okeania sp. SIO1H4]NES93389.1 ISAs1 family transposase [Okeania sp. SIO2B9]NET23860.1 ISAs1 family transposase [Okeania sp. SIO1H5]NET97601.1 ISAs1 family transposase [Okeania sp. SIO1H2]